ncbi:MAG TPA: protein kinase [Gemmatimonadaceae bacterium]|nr:protein kinase [Gemmatimonadaceae bacterium]
MNADLRTRLQESLGGAYVVERELGGGGMSRVFLAEETAFRRKVVVKVLAPELAEGLSAERFAREVRLVAQLQHPNIVPVLTAGASDGLPYFTMPFVTGESLRSLLNTGPIPVRAAVPLLRDVAKALAYAHKQGVVHRDIKPENILLSEGVAVVTDFGIAKALSNAGTNARDGTLTRLGTTIGTPAYMAPEQAAGDPAIDHRADLYAWGVVAYEVLAGRHPFAHKRSAHELIAAHISEPVPPLESGIAPPVVTLVRQCLAKDPNERPVSATELVDTLEGSSSSSPWATVDVAAAIAVLPFTNLSGDPNDEYFSDGMTEELIYALSAVKTLRVTARTSSFAFKRTAFDAREVASRLGVSAIVEGSVRRGGQRLRISVRLVNAKDGYERWSQRFDREVSDVFAVQEEIARSIAGELEVQFSGNVKSDAARPATRDLLALEQYLKGRFAWNQRTEAASADAVRYFESAVARDPHFARAYAGLADAYLALPMYARTPPTDAWPNAKAAALKALALDATLAEAHTALAYGTMLYEWDWPRAEASFLEAIMFDPAYSTAHHWYADFLAGRGRVEEALQEMQIAHSLDPVSRITGAELGWMLHLTGRSDDALRQLDQLLQLDPNYAHGHFIRGIVLTQQAEYPGAIAALRKALTLGGFYAFAQGVLVYALARAKQRPEAEHALAELAVRASTERIPPFAFALAYTGLGDFDTAFMWLDRAVAQRDELLAENFFDPLFGPLRSEQRSHDVMLRLGAVPIAPNVAT